MPSIRARPKKITLSVFIVLFPLLVAFDVAYSLVHSQLRYTPAHIGNAQVLHRHTIDPI